MRITVSNSSGFTIDKKKTRLVVRLFLKKAQVESDEVCIYYVLPKKIKSLHDRFFQDPSLTDCISLPIDSPDCPTAGPTILGEIFICPYTAELYAKENNKTFESELLLYLLHGLLHLIGYDDISSSERRLMRKKEKEYIKYIEAHLKVNP